MKRDIAIVAILVLLLSILSGASSGREADRLRVVSLAPSSTEILFALGLDDEIVGVSQFCNYPSRAASKDEIGTFSEPNIEKILWLKPDIIFCTGLEQAPVITKLRQLGLRVCVSDPSNLEELFGSIAEIGTLVGRAREARDLVARMKSDVSRVRDAAKTLLDGKRRKVFVEIWHTPLMSGGKGSMIDELITIAGGINIAHDIKTAYGSFSSEEVLKRDPDCIVLAYMQKGDSVDAVRSRLGWSSVSAVRNGRIYNDIDPDTLLRPGPRIAHALEELQERIYR